MTNTGCPYVLQNTQSTGYAMCGTLPNVWNALSTGNVDLQVILLDDLCGHGPRLRQEETSGQSLFGTMGSTRFLHQESLKEVQR